MLLDSLNRAVKDLRISVTDRCNFRCDYCMPLDEYEWIDRHELLTFEEITRLARLFIRLGVNEIRLTGGEPLLRRDLEKLVSQLAPLQGLNDLSLTTNGSRLLEKVPALAAAGLKRVNVSVDSLEPEHFFRITRRRNLPHVLDGLFMAKRLGLSPVKINAVVIRGINDADILDLAEFSRTYGFAIRFIEYMDAGNANNWQSEKLVPKKEILDRVNACFPLREVGRSQGTAPSVDYEFVDGRGELGVIASVTEPFCSSCTRGRLTADGKFVTCLFSNRGHDLKKLLRGGAEDETILETIRTVWQARSDRFSEDRLAAMQSADGYRARDHKKIEMISLGG
jgi:cyclic pyranopterin phosphate synthase